MTEKEKDLLADIKCYKNERAGLLRQIDELEQALDKACETLAKSKFKMTCGEAIKTCMENHCFGYSCVHSRNFTKEEWKEWCMKNETDN